MTAKLMDIRILVSDDVPLAKIELAKHVMEIRVKPIEMGADEFPIAAGERNLLEGVPEIGPTRQPSDWRVGWLRGLDLNQRPLGYEPNELPDCSTPQNHHNGM